MACFSPPGVLLKFFIFSFLTIQNVLLVIQVFWCYGETRFFYFLVHSSLSILANCQFLSYLFHLLLVQSCFRFLYFLSSANKVSTGPTCQFLSVWVWICVSSFFLRRLIGWYTGFWQWFWHPTYPIRCLDVLACLSRDTLKIFISGVSKQILML